MVMEDPFSKSKLFICIPLTKDDAEVRVAIILIKSECNVGLVKSRYCHMMIMKAVT
jgi:hypothetical protein